MDIVHGYGLTAAVVDAAEGSARGWSDLPGIDMVRVNEPAPVDVPGLLAAGFTHKPTRLTWLGATGADDEDFMGRLSVKQRSNVRVAARRAREEGLTVEVRWPVDEALLETFLALYERRVALMVNGLPLARRQAPEIAGNPDYFAIVGYRDGRLVGCTVCQHCPDLDMLRLRYSAVETDQRQASLARVMYLEAVRQARAAGHRWTTLGNDPNIYGHLVRPGLLAFKASLGFRPVPSHAVLPGDGNDEADVIVNLAAFADPTILLGYPAGGATQVIDGVEWPALEVVVLSADEAPDLHRYAVPGLAGPRLVRYPPAGVRGSPR